MHRKLKWVINLSGLFGILGVLSLLGAWFAKEKGIFGLQQEHLFLDAISFFLLAIWFLLWGFAYHHLKHEESQNFLELIFSLLSKVLGLLKKNTSEARVSK